MNGARRAAPLGARLAAVAGALGWVPDVAALAVSVVGHAVRPLNWRRTARGEFRRYLDLACFQQAPIVLLVAVLIGLGLVLQSLRLLRQVGQEGLVREVVVVLLVEQIAPVVIGLLIIGRSGLILYGELAEARRSGLPRALDAMGVDPFLFLVMPRCAAIAVSSFALTVFLVAAALLTGFGGAKLAGVAVGSLPFAIDNAISALGAPALLLTAFKAWLIGLVAASVFAHAALDKGPAGRFPLPSAFMRAFMAMMVVSVVVTVLG